MKKPVIRTNVVKNRYSRVFNCGIVRSWSWGYEGGKLRIGFDQRCNWCKGSYWWCYAADKWPVLCPSCVRYIRALEFPEALLVIQNDYPDEIPF